LFQQSQEAGAPSRNRMSGKPVRPRVLEVALRFIAVLESAYRTLATHPAAGGRVSAAQRFSRLSAN
jgi:hypothetical protein